MQINKHIGFDSDDGQGIDGTKFSREVFELDAMRPDCITFYTNSIGGDVREGLDMLNAISNAKCKTESIIAGFAYSTAGWCPLGADEVKAYDYSTWMCHLPYSPSGKQSEFLEKAANSIAIIISSKSGRNGKTKKTVEEVLSMMKSSTYYTAQDMLENGLIDSIVEAPASLAFNFNKEDVKGSCLKHQAILNKYIETKFKTEEKMPYSAKLLNKLNLMEGSGEDDVVESIVRLQNKANNALQDKKEAEDKLAEMKNTQEENNKKMLALQSSSNEASNKATELQTKLDAITLEKEANDLKLQNLEKEKKEAEEKAKTDLAAANKLRAETLINGLVDAKKLSVTDDKKIVWINKAIEDYEGTEALLESISTNFKAPDVINKLNEQTKNPKDDETVFGTDAYFKAQNRQKREAQEKQRLDSIKNFKDATGG